MGWFWLRRRRWRMIGRGKDRRNCDWKSQPRLVEASMHPFPMILPPPPERPPSEKPRSLPPPRQDRGMLRTRHTDQSAAAFCRQHGVSYQTLMNWRSSAAANSPSRNHHPHSSSSNSEPHASGPLVELELGGAIVLHYLSNPLCPAMIFTHSVKVCLATRPCDLRKSFDTLSIVGPTVSNIGVMRWHRSWRDALGLQARSAWHPNGFSTSG